MKNKLFLLTVIMEAPKMNIDSASALCETSCPWCLGGSRNLNKIKFETPRQQAHEASQQKAIMVVVLYPEKGNGNHRTSQLSIRYLKS